MEIQIREPGMGDFEEWWRDSFNHYAEHSQEVRRILYKEWEVMNTMPHLAYIVLQEYGKKLHAVAIARFVFVHPEFFNHVKNQYEGHVNIRLLNDFMPSGNPYILSIGTFNELNNVDMGIDCVISAIDFYRFTKDEEKYYIVTQIFKKFIMDTDGWRINRLYVTDCRPGRIKRYQSFGFRKTHRLHTEGKRDRLLLLNEELALKASSVLYPLFSINSPVINFTLRERQVLYLSCHSLSNRQIAETLDISVETVNDQRDSARERYARILKVGKPTLTQVKQYLLKHPEELRIQMPLSGIKKSVS